MDNKKVFNVRLPADLIVEMKVQAARESRSVSDIIIELFRDYLKRVKAKQKKP